MPMRSVPPFFGSAACALEKRLDAAGIRVWSLGSPTGKVRLQDPFDPHFDAFRRQVELARILGADHYRLFSFYGSDGSDAAFDRLMDEFSCREIYIERNFDLFLTYYSLNRIFKKKV